MNEIMMQSGNKSSKSISEELCPILLAQNAHLESLLRGKMKSDDGKVSKHLLFAAEGIREQNSALENFKNQNSDLSVLFQKLNEKLDSGIDMLFNHESPWSYMFTHSLPSLNSSDLLEKFLFFFDNCKNLLFSQNSEIQKLKETSLDVDASVEDPSSSHLLPPSLSQPHSLPSSSKSAASLDEPADSLHYSLDRSTEDQPDSDGESFNETDLPDHSEEETEGREEDFDEFEEFRKEKTERVLSIFEKNQKYLKKLREISRNSNEISEKIIDFVDSQQYLGENEVISEFLEENEKFRGVLRELLDFSEYSEFSTIFLECFEYLFEENQSKTLRIEHLINENSELLNQTESLSSESLDFINEIFELKSKIYHFSEFAGGESILDASPSSLSLENSDSNGLEAANPSFSASSLAEFNLIREKVAKQKEELTYWKDVAVKLKKKLEQSSKSLPRSSSGVSFDVESENEEKETTEGDEEGDDEEVAELKEKVKQISEENQTLSEIVEGNQLKIKELSENCEKLKKELGKSEENNSSLDGQLNKLKKTNQQMISQIAQLNVNSNQLLLNQKQNLINQLTKQKEELVRQLGDSKDQIEYLKNEKKSLEDSIIILRQNISNSQNSYLFKNTNLDASLFEFELENKNLDISNLRLRLNETLGSPTKDDPFASSHPHSSPLSSSFNSSPSSLPHPHSSPVLPSSLSRSGFI